ncbi:MAG: DUF192 domain-containing protein [Candidatus Binatia bacterium]
MSIAGCALILVVIFGSVFATACRARPEVAISTGQGRTFNFKVEIADTPSKRELGLQYRHDLATDRGMLFIFPEERQQSFWMKNTPIALDMIFINKERKIVGIVEQAVPFSLDSRSVGAQSQFVLEINGGLARRYGIQAGDKVRFENISPEGVKE